jgi:two-component system, OmpR family, alkaline phosphatase synthesis response regulator PhoP
MIESPRGSNDESCATTAAGQNHLTPDKSGAAPDTSGPILVIDDEPYILRSLSYLLQREGYTVETATNGEEGLKRVRSLRPPLVFLDIMMPHMNGYEVCEQVKQDPSLEGTYVIMLSAKGQQIDRERGLLGGADEYMTKPFSPREVAQRVRTILAERAAA